MNVRELKALLDKVATEDAEVRIVSNDDNNFYDGEVITGIDIIHNMVDGNDAMRVFVIGDASKTKN